jgi:hypothetical protein
LQKRNINDSAQLKITLAGVGGVKKTQLLIGGSGKNSFIKWLQIGDSGRSTAADWWIFEITQQLIRGFLLLFRES